MINNLIKLENNEIIQENLDNKYNDLKEEESLLYKVNQKMDPCYYFIGLKGKFLTLNLYL